ncbi:MAG: AbrB/MazE/SpoVT family DNA-binding domain-containing protein [Candidatus Korarchaeota archaeon]|nr:AbrB/MazE/SpoVT family DNA-binding domain-containing protein [Candidatus Korarchaeota archaeon]
MIVRRRVGPKGQIVIPKIIREFLGMEPGTEVLLEVQEDRLIIRPSMDPADFVNEFCSQVKEKLTGEVNLERILEEEVEERVALR